MDSVFSDDSGIRVPTGVVSLALTCLLASKGSSSTSPITSLKDDIFFKHLAVSRYELSCNFFGVQKAIHGALSNSEQAWKRSIIGHLLETSKDSSLSDFQVSDSNLVESEHRS
jgi:hypothetical protein